MVAGMYFNLKFYSLKWVRKYADFKESVHLAIGVLYFLMVKVFVPSFFIIDITVIAVLLSAFYIVNPCKIKVLNSKYIYLSVLFLIFSVITGVKTFYFFTILFAIFYFIESLTGSTGNLTFFLAILISPVFKYVNTMFGFPVRLQLSEWTGKLLTSMGYNIVVAGNVIIKNDVELSVDSACVGLKMMAYSILAGLILAAYFERKKDRHFSFFSITLAVVLIISLNIFSNFLRIILLTLFSILPQSPLHEIIGIVCFLVYTLLPAYFIVKKMGECNWCYKKDLPTGIYKRKTGLFINLFLFFGILFTGVFLFGNQVNKIEKSNVSPVKGYTYQVLDNEVIKMEKPGVLMYVKPVSRFYGAEHNPMICWIGSGYMFKSINTQLIEGNEIYTGILTKGNDKLFTAWWFDNVNTVTIKQTQWRWLVFKGEQFNLINVTSSNNEQLLAEIKLLMLKNDKKI